jgi:hypothetical protein
MQVVRAELKKLGDLTEKALFGEAGVSLVRLFRGAVGIALLLTLLSWAGSFYWFFSPEGYVPVGTEELLGKYFDSWLNIFSYPGLESYPAVLLAYILAIISACLLIVNKFPKVAAPIAYVLLLSFLGRNPALSYGGTDVLQFLLLGVVLLSLPGRKVAERWPIFLLQFQFALLYFTAGSSKLGVAEWLNGTKMFTTLSDPTFSYIDPQLLLLAPLLISFITWYGFISELAFAFLIWSKATRRYALAAVVLLHVGIIASMNVHLFSEMMLLGLTCLLTNQEADWLLERFHAAKTRVVSAVRGPKRQVN